MDDDDDDREFTAADRRRLRQMIEREERLDWFYGSLRVWGGYIAAGVGAGYAAYVAVRDLGLFKKLGGP